MTLKIKLAYFLDKCGVSVWFVHPGFWHLPKSSIHQHLSIIIIIVVVIVIIIITVLRF